MDEKHRRPLMAKSKTETDTDEPQAAALATRKKTQREATCVIVQIPFDAKDDKGQPIAGVWIDKTVLSEPATKEEGKDWIRKHGKKDGKTPHRIARVLACPTPSIRTTETVILE
jgi:hypothetical protein